MRPEAGNQCSLPDREERDRSQPAAVPFTERGRGNHPRAEVAAELGKGDSSVPVSHRLIVVETGNDAPIVDLLRNDQREHYHTTIAQHLEHVGDESAGRALEGRGHRDRDGEIEAAVTNAHGQVRRMVDLSRSEQQVARCPSRQHEEENDRYIGGRDADAGHC